MAAIAKTDTLRPQPIGDRVLRTFTVALTANASATEWVVTGLAWIDAVVGWAFLGTVTPTQAGATALEAPNFVKNAQGTGVAAGTNPGDLGIEILSGDATIEVTVIGRPKSSA